MIEYKLYTKQDCAPCASLKARLHLLGLENLYTECDTHESVHRNAVIDMGFRTVPQLVCVDMSYTDDLPYVLNTSSGNAATDGELTAFFKGFYEGWDNIFVGKAVPIGEDTRLKDRVKLGVSPSTIVEDWVDGRKV